MVFEADPDLLLVLAYLDNQSHIDHADEHCEDERWQTTPSPHAAQLFRFRPYAASVAWHSLR